MDQPKPTAAVSFSGKTFCFTGMMAAMKRREAELAVHARGGRVVSGPSRLVNYLVIGSLGNKAYKYRTHGAKTARARELIADGCGGLHLVDEANFLAALEGGEYMRGESQLQLWIPAADLEPVVPQRIVEAVDVHRMEAG